MSLSTQQGYLPCCLLEWKETAEKISSTNNSFPRRTQPCLVAREGSFSDGEGSEGSGCVDGLITTKMVGLVEEFTQRNRGGSPYGMQGRKLSLILKQLPSNCVCSWVCVSVCTQNTHWFMQSTKKHQERCKSKRGANEHLCFPELHCGCEPKFLGSRTGDLSGSGLFLALTWKHRPSQRPN